METTPFTYFMIITLSGVTPSSAADWSYSGPAGPLYWHEIFPEDCSGKYQSPIDIHPEETVYNPELKEFAIWYDPPKKNSQMYIKNNGHTVQVDLEGDFYVSNAGLSSVYTAKQFHFHWGHKAHHGSEHLIDGKPSPIEISETDNPSLTAIVKALKHVKDPEKQNKAPLPLMSLRDFLPKDISRYYRYNGSLTTPGCFESVIWTVFDVKQTISHKQLKEFTNVLQMKHKVKKEEHNRHRRSLTKEERDKERRARNVLDELGIRGNEFEEARLQSELMHSMMMGDQAHDKSADNAAKHPPKPTRKADDDMAELADVAIEGRLLDNYKTHTKAENQNHKHKDEVAEVEDAYTQETIVNNFRPVQPLNDRLVYRSFKHVCVAAPEDIRAKWPPTPAVEASKEESQGGKNACGRLDNLSTAVMLLLLAIGLLHV
ncbi:hypothetical protein BsWGS_01380 [Bradybaena similaris]